MKKGRGHMKKTLQKEAIYACTYPKQLNTFETSSKIWNDISKVSNWDQKNNEIMKIRLDLIDKCFSLYDFQYTPFEDIFE
jgi:hypothetical protein